MQQIMSPSNNGDMIGPYVLRACISTRVCDFHSEDMLSCDEVAYPLGKSLFKNIDSSILYLPGPPSLSTLLVELSHILLSCAGSRKLCCQRGRGGNRLCRHVQRHSSRFAVLHESATSFDASLDGILSRSSRETSKPVPRSRMKARTKEHLSRPSSTLFSFESISRGPASQRNTS